MNSTLTTLDFADDTVLLNVRKALQRNYKQCLSWSEDEESVMLDNQMPGQKITIWDKPELNKVQVGLLL